MKTKVAIIILNWNGKDDTLECLSSLEKVDNGAFEVSIVVVDNGSTDGSVATIKNRYQSVIVIENTDNIGFTGGNNTGIEWALQNGNDFIWILNNDTTVDKHALTTLIDSFQNGRNGMSGSKIYFSPGHEFHYHRYGEKERGKVIWYAGGIIDWDNIYGSHRGVDEVDHGQYDRPEETQFVTGCSMMLSRQMVETVGMFDQRYFAYLEDMDLAMRAARAGFSVMYIPTSLVWHKNAGSTARPGNAFHQYYITRNRLLFGFTYASSRTKFALVREAFRLAVTGSAAEKHAIIDAALGRFGKQFEWKT
jgi:hypothetical protein